MRSKINLEQHDCHYFIFIQYILIKQVYNI